MFHRGEIITIKITDYAFGGKGVAKLSTDKGEFVVFVNNAYPGQLVKAKVSKKKKRYCEAKLIDVIERSEDEVQNEFQEISGAPYIFVPIEKQKEIKLQSTLDVYRRLGNFPKIDEKLDEWVSSPEMFFYRNKMEYSFSCIEHDILTGEEKDAAFALGFKRRGTWWKVESLNKSSGLFDKEWESKLYQIREYLEATNLPAWHPPQKKGFFRHIVVRKSFAVDKLLVNLVTSSEGKKQFNTAAFGQFLQELFGNRIAGFQHTINDDIADRAKIENGTYQLVFGEPVIIEKLLGLSFEISMESFFQTNPKCAEKLYTKALDYVFEEKVAQNEVVMDLFCGTGTIGQILSAKKEHVQIVGVDIVPEAIEDAKRNAKRNKIENIDFIAEDVGKFLLHHPEYAGKIKTIILDPPRAGIAPKTLRKVMRLEAENIVYISCNPSTQARDAATLRDAGYQLEKVALVDQFPHTGHIEAVAKFKLEK